MSPEISVNKNQNIMQKIQGNIQTDYQIQINQKNRLPTLVTLASSPKKSVNQFSVELDRKLTKQNQNDLTFYKSKNANDRLLHKLFQKNSLEKLTEKQIRYILNKYTNPDTQILKNIYRQKSLRKSTDFDIQTYRKNSITKTTLKDLIDTQRIFKNNEEQNKNMRTNAIIKESRSLPSIQKNFEKKTIFKSPDISLKTKQTSPSKKTYQRLNQNELKLVNIKQMYRYKHQILQEFECQLQAIQRNYIRYGRKNII